MFTGLIEDIGLVLWIRATDKGTQLQVNAPRIAASTRRGESIAVNGCCLTVAAHRDEHLTFDLLQETIDSTNLRHLRRGTPVNLERALSPNGRLGGHFVQGHIDCAARVIAFGALREDHRLEVELPADFSHYVACKGSIAINGISLTVAELLPSSFATWIIPHTKRHTNLDGVEAGDYVNLEFDVLAKYVERLLPRFASRPEC
jgi:riboflavin synthase